MDSQEVVSVNYSGSSGASLRPVSRPEMPKQLPALTVNQTMLQLTSVHAHGGRFAALIVVANARHAVLVEQQLKDAGASPQSLILEPTGRNTEPAIAFAAIAAGGGGRRATRSWKVSIRRHVYQQAFAIGRPRNSKIAALMTPSSYSAPAGSWR